jgi:microcystin-dependent protein
MAYPATPPPDGRTDSTPLPTNHPTDHNLISAAITDIVNELGSDPKGNAASLTARLDEMDPADKIIAIGGSTAPTGWGLCDGTAYLKATYPGTDARLSAAGYPYGSTATHFNVPDLRSKFIAGKGTASWSNALTDTGGSANAVAVAHTHTFNHDHPDTFAVVAGGGSHAHVEGSETGQGWLYSGAYNGVRFDVFVGSGLSGARSTYGYTQPSTSSSGSTHNHTISGSVSNNGTGDTTAGQSPTSTATNTNLPPYQTLNYCIRLR